MVTATVTDIELKVKIITVTPQMAEIWLKRNVTNRKLRPTKVDQWANAMRREEWTLSPDCIAFDEDGNLTNGQHRLNAVKKVGQPQPFVVLEGLPRSVQKHTDIGQKRNMADYFHMERGEPNSHLLSATLTALYRWRKNASVTAGGGYGMPSAEELEAVFDSDADEIRASVRKAQYVTTKIPTLNPTTLALAHYLFTQLSPEEADEFMDLLATGAGMQEGHPVLTLREMCMNYAVRRIAATNNWRIAVLIKAWNALRRGEEKKLIRWTPSDKMPIPV